MQLSMYTLIVENYPSKGEHLLYHTRTQAMVTIKQELKDLLNDLSAPQNVAMRMRYAEELEQMRKMDMLVENRWEDVKKLVRFLGDLKYEKYGSMFAVTVLTTLDCNFQCSYCFEEGVRRNVSMTLPTSDAVIGWIRDRMLAHGYKDLRLTFYGGEPLLNEEVLEYMAGKLSQWCTAQGFSFKFNIQTNGYLLTAERVKKYLLLGLTDVRISLDGVGEEHNRQRHLRGGGGTFDRIITNILDNVDQVKIGISVSYDRWGVEHVGRLLDYLEGLGILHKLGRFICSPVHPSLGLPGRAEATRNSACLMNYSDAELVRTTLAINNLLEHKGLLAQKGLPIAACPMGREHGGVTIDPEGALYACNSMVGHQEFSIGDVFSSQPNNRRSEFLNMDVGLQCQPDCTFLPVCNGGCRLMSYLETGRLDVPNCKKGFLEQVAPELVKKEYEVLMRLSSALAEKSAAAEKTLDAKDARVI
ncbi:MAG: SPASM domain-containing protein [Candidatus Omnitrophica bacterium]|nr:SPASM domain-containing protein [Candidatus Omnitrophota bacterium]